MGKLTISVRHCKLICLVAVLLWFERVVATSTLEHLEIPDPHRIDDVEITSDGVSLTVELRIGSTAIDDLSNLRRRQWAHDPIGAATLKKAAAGQELFGDSRELYAYLLRNTTLEDSSEIVLRLDLQQKSTSEQPNIKLSGSGVESLMDSTPIAYSGRAMRRVAPMWPPGAPLEWRDVGEARATVDGEHVLASFGVDDENGLGVPAASYKLATPFLQPYLRSLSPRAAPDDATLLWCDKNFGALTGRVKELSFLAAQTHQLRQLLSRSSDTGNSGVSGGSLYGSIGVTSGCPTRKKIAVVGAALDCNFLSQFNSTSNAILQVIDSYSSASPWTEQAFNVALGLGEIYVPECSNNGFSKNSSDTWDYACGSGTSNDRALEDRLDRFSKWRSKRAGDDLAAWTLWTSCSSSSTVGLSQSGALCNPNAGCSLVKQSGTNDARVLAHELGHTFGAVHDCTSESCDSGLDQTGGCCPLSTSACNANGGYLMNPAVGSATSFSPCSIGEVCRLVGSGYTNSTCLKDSSARLTLVTPGICGNGIVEEGEDCDCGGPNGCGNNSCCDPLTCKFTSGSQCDDSNSPCCENCQFSPQGVVCANSSDPCVVNAVCSGNSSTCPPNVRQPDGSSCSSNSTSLKCYSGKCTSRDQQCLSMVSGNAYDGFGNRLTLVGACGDGCSLSCLGTSRFGQSCYTFSGRSFIDGTPCGSGSCQSGFCQLSTANGRSWTWLIVTVVAIAVAAAALIWLISCCRKSRRRPSDGQGHGLFGCCGGRKSVQGQAHPPSGPGRMPYPYPVMPPPSHPVPPLASDAPPYPPNFPKPPPAYTASNYNMPFHTGTRRAPPLPPLFNPDDHTVETDEEVSSHKLSPHGYPGR